jgi:DNA-binding NtrC family response regulator
VHFDLPPLRARGNDVLVLAEHYLGLQRARYRKPQLRFTAEAERAMLRYTWPGNVRELRNVIEQAVIMATSGTIDAVDLRLTSTLALPSDGDATADGAEDGGDGAELNLAEVERDLLVRALAQTRGNVTQAARLLGVTRDTLRYRIEKYNLELPQ